MKTGIKLLEFFFHILNQPEYVERSSLMINHQVSTSFLLGNLGSWFVSVGPELNLEISVNYRPDLIFVYTT